MLSAICFNPFGEVIADSNTFYGTNAGINLTTGYDNSGFGDGALHFNDTGFTNTASGERALYYNTSGSRNVAIGYGALHHNVDGCYNTAYGEFASAHNASGCYNTALDIEALRDNEGSNNIALGRYAGAYLANGSYNIVIRDSEFRMADDNNLIRIGACDVHTDTYVAGIYGTVVAAGTDLLINSLCKLSSRLSSANCKEDILPMSKASESIFSLRPVTFQYKQTLDSTRSPQFGLVAEEVAQINLNLVDYDTAGAPYTVRYQAVNAVLLNEVLKADHSVRQEEQENRKQQSQLTQLRSIPMKQKREIADLGAGVRKMANELALDQPALRLIENTSLGMGALSNNTTGSTNSAFGSNALFANTEGQYKTANGCNSLYTNSTGIANTATGRESLYTNNGAANAAVGSQSLFRNTTGNDNTAAGKWSGYNNTAGQRNTALGYRAGYYLTTGDLNIDIGNEGVADEAKTIRIGTVGPQTKTYLAGIFESFTRGIQVLVDSSGHLGTVASSARFKENIQDMGKASEAILSLRPVTYRYKKELDPGGTAQFGLIAEEVAKVAPELVINDEHGKPYAVRYEAVNAIY